MSNFFKFKRRRKKTLIAWWNLLNSWGWPKEIPDPEPRDSDNGRRSEIMREIESELGRRVIFGRSS